MKYIVIVEADGASIEQVKAAQRNYLEVLEAGTGGSTQVLSCVRAWAKGVERGLNSRTQDEEKQSAAWLIADARARIEATRLLEGATGVHFLFKLSHP